jgi:hydroxymethylpyrimidine/phosphomethylpyrimidine kinase
MIATSRAGKRAIALTIAGSDSSGGAGIQADLKTFSAFGVYGASVIVALTAQNTRGVQGVYPIPPAFVAEQMTSVLSDLDVSAVKTGMLATPDIVETVVAGLQRGPVRPLVVDPVMVATSGDTLLAPEAVDAVKRLLIPVATLITPNIPEAAILLGCPPAVTDAELISQAEALKAAGGAQAVLLKGGHGSGGKAVDVLVDDRGVTCFELERIATPNTHGTGCTLSAAITALLAQGLDLEQAVRRAKSYVWHALEHGRRLGVGTGRGPVDHLFAVCGETGVAY